MTGQAGPGWSPARNLSCTNCKVPYLVADSDRVKRLIATSQYGCVDTAYLILKVPPANDYTIDLNDVQCASGDRLYVNFTLYNQFRRGVIPKGLTVSFYEGDPATATARLLSPVFSVQDTVFEKQFIFNGFIKGSSGGRIYAVVNDSGTAVPVQLPNNRLLPEKDYSNNRADFLYERELVRLSPTDTTVFKGTSLPVSISSTIYNAASTTWFNGNGYTLSCTQCTNPVVKIWDSSTVSMQTENRYGCLIRGTAVIKIIPPDITIKIIETKCYTDTTTLVRFTICMGNGYDTVFAGMPVSFYDRPSPDGKGGLLSPVFYTATTQPGNCYSYEHIVSTPASNHLYAVVNDKGGNPGPLPDKVFEETDYSKNDDKGSL
ncbi:MAG: hypothetical protein WKI04_10745 [Ferruginibacter sp.]